MTSGKLLTVLTLLLCSIFTTQFAQPGSIAESKGMAAIYSDKENGIISADEALLQKFYFGFEKDKLGLRYFFKDDIPSKCGTEIIQEFQKARNSMGDFTRTEIERILSRKASSLLNSEVYFSPSGIFELAYVDTGLHAVPSDDSDRNGIPDYVEKVAEIFDYCWRYTIDTLGFLPPPLQNGTYYISFENMDFYGYTQWAGDKQSYIVLHNTFIGFPLNTDPEGNEIGAAKVTAIHEFKHAIQLMYNDWNEPIWFRELDATWIEDIGYDYVNDYYNYMWASQIQQPGRSFSEGGGYEDCLWMHYLTQSFGINVNREIWERIEANTESIYTSFDMVLNSHQSDFSSAISEYFTWNFLSGNYYDSGLPSYEEAAFYPSPNLCDGIKTIPDSGTGCPQNALSALFLYFETPDADDGVYYDLSMSSNIDETSLNIIHKYNDGKSEIVQIEQSDNQFNLLSEIDLSELEYVTIIPVVTAQAAFNIMIDYNMSLFQPAIFEHTPLTDTEHSGDFPVTLNLQTPGDIALRDSLRLFYKIGAGDYTSRQMVQGVDENEYTGLIPDPGYEVEVSYYFSIYDSLDRYSYHPKSAPAEAITFYVGVDTEIPLILYEDYHQILSKYNFPFPIIARISDNLGIAEAEVEYGIGDLDNLYIEPLVRNDSGYYRADISIDTSFVKSGDVFSYKISATDSSSVENVSFFPELGLKEIIIEDAALFSSKPDLTIPDNSNLSIRDTITVNENISISDVDIILKATHERISDFEIKLKPPVGSVKTLLKRPGLYTDHGNASNPDIILDNEAVYSMLDFKVFDTTTTSGMYKPSHMNLAALNGKSALGNWILLVYDRAEGKTGTLDEWGLIIRGETITGIEKNQNSVEEFRLFQNYPNPFNPATIIQYSIPVVAALSSSPSGAEGTVEGLNQNSVEMHVNLKVYNILGQQVAILVNEHQRPGNYQVNFNGSALSSGVYYYRLVSGEHVKSKKMLLLK